MRKLKKTSRSLELPDATEWSRIAGDPSSDPVLLQALCALSNDEKILASLARNPGTPKHELQRLWRNDPAAVLENPIVFLWEFTSPGSATRILSKDVQFRLYQHLLLQEVFDPKPELIDEECVVDFLASPIKERLRLPLHLLVRDNRRAIRCALLKSCVKGVSRSKGEAVRFPQDAIMALAVESCTDVAEALAAAIANDWLSPEPRDSAFLASIADILVSRNRGNRFVASLVAKWPCLDEKLIEKLASNADESLLALLAAHPRGSADFQLRMASHESEIVRSGVATVVRSDSLVRKLAMDPAPVVRAKLATLPRLPEDVQRALYEKKDPRILQGLLHNNSTIGELLESMSRLPFLMIDQYICKHPNTPAHVLGKYPRPRSSSDSPIGSTVAR
jgi:hypothetical protein